MLLTSQSSVLSFSVYFIVAAGHIFDNAGINSVRELVPIVDTVAHLVPTTREVDHVVQRVAYMLLTLMFLFFVFVVLLRYLWMSKRPESMLHVLGAGLLFFLFAVWCVS